MKRTSQVRGPGRGGFTIVEVLVASAVSLTVAAVTLTAFIYILQSWHGVELRMQADRDMNIAMSRMVYGMEELPARHEEVEHAIEEGIVFKTLNNPVKINGDDKGYVSSMTCIEMELGEPDASGRRRPIEKVGSEFDLPVDCVIMSLGTTPNPLIKNTTPGLEVNKKGGIVVNEAGLTSHQNVYAGGDAVTGAATVILAMGAGKLGAKSIDEALSNK